MGCASHHTRTYQEFDRSDKSISMPIGSGGLLGDIKDGFIRNGYRVIADTGGVRTTGVAISEQVSQSEHKPRYKLFLNYYETPVLNSVW